MVDSDSFRRQLDPGHTLASAAFSPDRVSKNHESVGLGQHLGFWGFHIGSLSNGKTCTHITCQEVHDELYAQKRGPNCQRFGSSHPRSSSGGSSCFFCLRQHDNVVLHSLRLLRLDCCVFHSGCSLMWWLELHYMIGAASSLRTNQGVDVCIADLIVYKMFTRMTGWFNGNQHMHQD